MSITIAMIEEKEFKTKIKGYDPVEVDEFLDEICDEIAALQEEIATLQSQRNQAGRPAAPLTPVPAPAAVPVPSAVPVPAAKAAEPKEDKKEETSEAAKKLLSRAQKMYDDMIADAKEEADQILQEARDKADHSIEALAEEKKTLESEIEMLKAAAKDYKARFLALIEDQQHVLKAESALFE